MSRWTQYEEDSYRLPEGMTRIGYDADTSQYSYQDENGVRYRGAPGARYGTLTRVSSASKSTRPNAFDGGLSDDVTKGIRHTSQSTFYDILPPSVITSSSSSEANEATSPQRSPREQLIQAVRKSALPKMQGVVHNLRRSVTTTRRTSDHNATKRLSGDSKYEKKGLLRHDSQMSTTSTVSSVAPSVSTIHAKSIEKSM